MNTHCLLSLKVRVLGGGGQTWKAYLKSWGGPGQGGSSQAFFIIRRQGAGKANWGEGMKVESRHNHTKPRMRALDEGNGRGAPQGGDCELIFG